MSDRNGWKGTLAGRARRAMAARLPCPCFHCGLLVGPADAWDVEHKVPLADGGSVSDPANWAISHASCNRRGGAAITHQNRTRVRKWV